MFIVSITIISLAEPWEHATRLRKRVCFMWWQTPVCREDQDIGKPEAGNREKWWRISENKSTKCTSTGNNR